MLAEAQAIRSRIIQRLRDTGARDQAERLEADGYPGDDEMHVYAAEFGCAILVVPTDEDAMPIICGEGPVGMEVQHTFGRGAGGVAGHFVLVRSWLQPPRPRLLETAGGDPVPAEAGGDVRRRLRGKQRPPAAYGAATRPGKRLAGRKKKAGRRGNSDLCPGFEGAPCIFSVASPGRAAACRNKGQSHCVLCSRAAFDSAASTPRGRGSITRVLKGLCMTNVEGNRAQAWQVASERVRLWAPAQATEWLKKAQQAKRAKPKPKAERCAAQEEATKESWATCLRKRQKVAAKPSFEERKRYRAAVLEDQRVPKKKCFPDTPRAERATGEALAEIPSNDTGLPAASVSATAIGLQNWCCQGAWGMCPTCGVLQKRPLQESDLDRVHGPCIYASACTRCKAKYVLYVPQPEDVSKPLRKLSPAVIEALRPLDIEVGPEVRAAHGYRKKARMITFAWAAKSVDAKIEALPSKAERHVAKKAKKYLLEHKKEIFYDYFHRKHEEFLQRYEGQEPPTDRQRRRPLHFIEEVGLETALWPHLYWKVQMCESYERITDNRLAVLQDPRAARKQRARDMRGSSAEEASDTEGGSDSEAQDPEDRPHSIKRSFAAKLGSPLLGYGADFSLLQYVYDLHLWTDLGSKKQLAHGPNMRLKMKDHPMSPLYWADLKHALFDLVKQLGFPQLYWTIAPYERSYPYHGFLQDEMSKTLRARMGLPAFEAMHLTHTLMQICRGLIAGYGMDKKGKPWSKHLLSCKDGSGQETSLHFFARLEFQDGSKKQGTQQYHGSGRPHVHALFWLDNVAAAKLETVASATQPTEPASLAAFVKTSQLDQDGVSKWPIHLEPSGYDEEEELLRLHHTEEDAADGLRGYFVDIMDALRCHQDLQVADGRALLMVYVAKYVAKWSDSSYDEWMSEAASATSLCRKVLFEYHPFEPEMALQLNGALYRQWALGTASGGRRSLRAPRPNSEEQPAFVDLYMTCPWRSEEMSLLEWLRKSDEEGRISAWLRKKHAAAVKSCPPDEAPSLEAFANEYIMRGEQLAAAEYLWRMNDLFYGQWAMMNLPFRSMGMFQVPVVR